MAVDEAGLERAATECAPGEVGWDANVGRFRALVKQLWLGGERTLHGLPLPNPQEEGFDAAVEKMFRAAAEQSASQPGGGTNTDRGGATGCQSEKSHCLSLPFLCSM